MSKPTREEYEARMHLLGYDFYDEQTNTFWRELRGGPTEPTYEEVDADTLERLSVSDVFARLGTALWPEGRIRISDTFNGETDPQVERPKPSDREGTDT